MYSIKHLPLLSSILMFNNVIVLVFTSLFAIIIYVILLHIIEPLPPLNLSLSPALDQCHTTPAKGAYNRKYRISSRLHL